jgi:predicted Zn-dependent protease
MSKSVESNKLRDQRLPTTDSWLYREEQIAGLSRLLRSCLRATDGRERVLQAWLSGEETDFLRVSQAQVRQGGQVRDMSLELTLYEKAESGYRKSVRSFALTGIQEADWALAKNQLNLLQDEVSDLPVDPFAEPSQDVLESFTQSRGELLPVSGLSSSLLRPAEGLDLVGIYAGGPMVRAMFSSLGARHTYQATSFFWDYSIYTPERRAIKAGLAGSHFDQALYLKKIEEARSQLEILSRPSRTLKPGDYRVFLTPSAFSHLVEMLSWGAVSEFAIQKGLSPLRLIREGKNELSPLFSLSEHFEELGVPRFNRRGDLAAPHLTLFDQGRLISSLVSARSAAEFGMNQNGASEDETLRAPCVRAGDLALSDGMKALGTGLYLSELHYLNWSDQPAGRITGMTRFACFWVEDGKPVAPIENLRFDDTIFRFFGSELEALTREVSVIPSTSTYGERSTQSMRVPGALLKTLRFTG